jgi:DNA polymerase III alpha subunit
MGPCTSLTRRRSAGVKPILGCELYICQNEDHRAPGDGDENNHLLVLAQNEEGYQEPGPDYIGGIACMGSIASRA